MWRWLGVTQWLNSLGDLLLLYVLPGLVIAGLIIFILNMRRFFSRIDDDD